MLRILILFISITLLFACANKQTVSSKGASKKALTEEKEIDFGRFYIDATKEKVLGNYEKAAKLYKQALSIDPYSAAATNYELRLVL